MPRTSSSSSGNRDDAPGKPGLMGSLSRFWHASQTQALPFHVKNVLIALFAAAFICRRLYRLRTAPGGLYVCLSTLLEPLAETACTDWHIQILTIAEPFHRMFSLDNIAIQFPHAAIERVPVSTSPPPFTPLRWSHLHLRLLFPFILDVSARNLLTV